MSNNRRIFICDDDEEALSSLKRLLELSGFEVKTTKTPHEVVAIVKAFRPDVILLDLLMPGMGGLEICEMLNDDEEIRNIPIIIISVLSKEIDIKKAYKLGVIGYFSKPYDFNDVLEEINKIISFKGNKNAGQ